MDTPPHDLEPHELDLYKRFKVLRRELQSVVVDLAASVLHRIDVLGSGGKPGDIRYTYTDAEMRATLKDLEKKGRRWKDPIQRYKGLGEMDAAQLRDTTMSIGSRQLRRINVKDAEAASRVFDLLMGSDVAPRKEFIIAGAGSLDRESIDA